MSTGLLGTVPAQTAGRATDARDPQDRNTEKYSEIRDYRLREKLQLEDIRKRNAGKYRRMESEPWVTANGDQLVGIVNDRFLTKPELNRRADFLLRQAEKLDDPDLELDRRVTYEGTLLADWIQTTALATHALQLGLNVTDDEVQQALTDLATRNDVTPSETLQRSRYIGFPEAELKQEITDSLLVEKLVHKRINEFFSVAQMRQIYQAQPGNFIKPPRVRAWQLFFPLMQNTSPAQIKPLVKSMESWRKKLRNCETEADLATLQKEVAAYDGLTLKDIGWVSRGDMMPSEVQKALFSLEPGETSDVIQSTDVYHLPVALNVVKVLESVPGEERTFEQARPEVEALLFEKVKYAIFQSLKPHMKIMSNSGGLRLWHEVKEEPVRPSPNAPTTAEPDLGGLRATLGGEDPALIPPPVDQVLFERAQRGQNARNEGTAPAEDDVTAVPPMEAPPQ